MRGPKPGNREQTEPFAMYEDTEFLPEGGSRKPDVSMATRNAGRPPRKPEGRSTADESAKTENFGVYQVDFLSL